MFKREIGSKTNKKSSTWSCNCRPTKFLQVRIFYSFLESTINKLTIEKIKKRVIELIKMKDKGILGAFMLYQDDRDFEGFKARIIHKVMTPNGSRENREAENAHSAAATGF